MKTRQGFVSNSSSTSYLISLPKNFSITKALSKTNIEKLKKNIKENWEREPLENLDKFDHRQNVTEHLQYLLETGFIEDNPDEKYDEDDDIAQNIIHVILEEYIVGEIEGGPDRASCTVLVDTSRSKGDIDKILEKRKQRKAKNNKNNKGVTQ